ncbi:MAG TPA: hypothetical protein DD990_17490 [Cyanobacteria bacterium UBA11368]|nr:hypothetical protein [Cyanobacteria bacterium UBA11368]
MGRIPKFDSKQECWVVYRQSGFFEDEESTIFAAGDLDFCLKTIGYFPRADLNLLKEKYGDKRSDAMLYTLGQYDAKEYLKIAKKAKTSGRIEDCGEVNSDTIVCLNANYFIRYKELYAFDLECKIEFIKENKKLYSQREVDIFLTELKNQLYLLTENPGELAASTLINAKKKALYLQSSRLCR